jgi:Xaa-Pro dipeptidase
MTAQLARLSSVHQLMDEKGIDLLICRLNQNIVMLSGYWPMNGVSLVVIPKSADPFLIVPEQDERWLGRSWIQERSFIKWGATHTADPFSSMIDSIRDRCRSKRIKADRIGMELDCSLTSLPAWTPEIRQWGTTDVGRLRDVFPESDFMDANPLLQATMNVKTSEEIARIRLANQVAKIGVDVFLDADLLGMTECEVAASVEYAVNSFCPSDFGGKLVRAWAHVMSGSNGQYGGQTYNISTRRRISSGESVLLELGVVVEGYWSDLARTRLVGIAEPTQDEANSAVRHAFDAAVAAAIPGRQWCEVDQAAREAIGDAGFAHCFSHITGHGVGFCYHEASPTIGPLSAELIQSGQTFAIEPGIYHSSLGGIRHEENFVITSTGAENLMSEISDQCPKL